MMPFFYDNLHSLKKMITLKLLISSVLNESKSATSLCKTDLSKKEYLMNKSNIGFAATTNGTTNTSVTFK